MRGESKTLSLLKADNEPIDLFLEKDSIDAFIRWVEGNTRGDFSIPTNWTVYVLKYQLQSFGDYQKRRRALSTMGLQVVDIDSKPSDQSYIEEVRRIYFSHKPVSSQQLAKFYVTIRRCAEIDYINIISQDKSFWRIPWVNTYHNGLVELIDATDFPPQFNFIDDFGIHRELISALQSTTNKNEFGSVVYNGIIALRDYIRRVSGLTNEGWELMEQAFKRDGSSIKLNPLTDTDPTHSQVNEQDGFRTIYCGLWKGIRNPLAHEGPNSTFAQNRYPDQKTLYKYLAFLSLLFERVDGPLP